MLIMDRVNLNHLRVFESVHRHLSMTKASKELHLTQSGVSQHIKALEESLNVSLFNRVNHKIVPTALANTLADKCRLGFSELEKTLWIITKQENELVGRVKIGLPDEFGHNVVVPIVGRFLKDHHEVQCEFFFGTANLINEQVKSGLLDFGLVDGYSVDKTLQSSKVYEEKFKLIGSKKYLSSFSGSPTSYQYFNDIEFLAYIPGEPVLKMWFTNSFGKKDPRFHVRAYSPTPSSILKLILSDLGVGALPVHLIDLLSKSVMGKLVSLQCSKKNFKNPVSLVSLPIRQQSRAAQAMLDFVVQGLKEYKK